MSIDFNLQAEVRNDTGRGAARRLRRQKRLPAVIYGAGKEPVSVTLDHDEILTSLDHEAFFSHVLTVNYSGRSEQVVLRDLQRHPTKPVLLHADFQRTAGDTKLRVQVPLHFEGEEMAPGVREESGVINHLLSTVEVSCLPKDLPEYIEVDMSHMHAGDSIHLSDLKLPAGVEVPALAGGPDYDQSVVTIVSPRGGVVDEEGGEEVGEEEGEV